MAVGFEETNFDQTGARPLSAMVMDYNCCCRPFGLVLIHGSAIVE